MKRSFSVGLLILIILIGYGQKKQADFEQIIENRFKKQINYSPQEKLYLHTDKPYYSAGEEIWFKGYLVNAATLEPSNGSQFIYIELIDKFDSVQYRVKIKKDSLGFAGHIKLKPETPTGFYSLRAYSYWMQNVGNDFFYSKNILIGNTIDDRVSSNITYGTPIDGIIPATLTFTDAYKNPLSGNKVEITQNWDSSKRKKLKLFTDKNGKVAWEIYVNSADKSSKNIGILMEDEKYNSNIALPEFSSDFDVQFFPESGVLLNNSLQTIAFKAIRKDGLSVEITGKIFTDKNEEISELTTFHKGMGKFSIQTQPNETYYAIVKMGNGIEKRFELPKTQEKGIALHLVYNRNKILYQVDNNTDKPNKSLYLLLHAKAKVYVIQQLDKLEGQVPESLLPAGIVTFSVIDTEGNTYCERLCFVRNFNFPTITMQGDKSVFGKRELVKLDFNVRSMLGKPVNGDFSISITDTHTVKQDSLGVNILNNLLLTSDIKGYVEEPSSYFVDNKIVTREKTDILMRTQGWRRFNTSDVVKSIYHRPKFYMEKGQALSGKVLNLFNKTSKKCDIIMISPYKSVVRTIKTDSLGRYLIDGIEFPDSTSFVLKAKKAKSFTDVEIVPDNDDFPAPSIFIATPLIPQANTLEQEEFFKQSKEKYFTEGGMRVVNLDAVTVTADKKTNTQNDYYSGMASNEITSEQLATYSSMSVINILRTIAGLQVSEDGVSIRGGLGSAMFIINNVEVTDITDVTYLTSNDLERIEVFKGAEAAIFGSRGGNGVIAITLKEGIDIKRPTPISLAHIIPLGYQKSAQFYVPKYDVDSVLTNPKADLRTTIYWNPAPVCNNSGNIEIKFYTADMPTNYSVILEGITTTGEICRYVGTIKRQEK